VTEAADRLIVTDWPEVSEPEVGDTDRPDEGSVMLYPETSPPCAVSVNEPLRLPSVFRVSVTTPAETASVPGDDGGGDGGGLGGCEVRPGVGDVPPPGVDPRGDPDEPEAEADGEPDTLMVRPMCLPPLPLPLGDGDDGDTGVDPEFSGAWLTAAGPTVAADAVGAPL
jgi:hypothetical protein